MAGEISKPHDHLFRSVFGEEREAEAASLLQAYLPEAISRELRWSSLRWQSVSFVDDRLRGSESDLLYAIERAGDGAPAWLYVLLELLTRRAAHPADFAACATMSCAPEGSRRRNHGKWRIRPWGGVDKT